LSQATHISPAFTKAYTGIHEDFWRFCNARVYGRMEVDDLVHDTLLVAHQKFDGLEDKKKLLSYMIGIAIRLLSNDYKKKKEVSGLPLKEPISEDNSDRRSDVDFLYRAIAKLPSEQGEAIILFEISGYSLKEIAQLQNAGLSAVKLRLKRGRAKLKALLTEPTIHPPKTIEG